MQSELNKKLLDAIENITKIYPATGNEKAANECEKICLQYFITILDEEEFGRGSFNRDEYKSRIQIKLQEQLNQLK